VLAHEFQHLILGNQDRNEETFLNEGASVMSEYLNGNRNLGYDFAFLSDPDTQLNSNDQSYEMYGAGFLFQAYFLDRFGTDATKQLIANQDNGLRSIESTLAQLALTDSVTGEQITL
jgi:immune inhibitor A